MPILYYVFDYTSSVYTELLYTGAAVVVEFLGFMLCLSYILFLLLYFREYEEKCEAEQKTRLMEMQHAHSKKELEAICRAEREIAILRHDMRHYLSNIFTFVENGENDKAMLYVKDIISTVEATGVQKYCKNEIVNIILSSHEAKINESGIDFRVDIRIPERIDVSDVDITAILSNALENAIQATCMLEKGKRRIEFCMHIGGNKLLLSVKNTFAITPAFTDGLPVSKERGHGIGTQSIRYIVEKLGGNSRFAIEDNMFVLQIIL